MRFITSKEKIDKDNEFNIKNLMYAYNFLKSLNINIEYYYNYPHKKEWQYKPHIQLIIGNDQAVVIKQNKKFFINYFLKKDYKNIEVNDTEINAYINYIIYNNLLIKFIEYKTIIELKEKINNELDKIREPIKKLERKNKI